MRCPSGHGTHFGDDAVAIWCAALGWRAQRRTRRIFGARGAGLFAARYRQHHIVVTAPCLELCCLSGGCTADKQDGASRWRELKEGFAYLEHRASWR